MSTDSHQTKHIFVTGGVVSSLGKGITASSLGMLLTARGLTVVMQKLDPYLNVDPGTMNPFQHGEVFVTEDGGECDLDVGHYERFLNRDLTKGANVTTGQIYASVIERERRGDYQGATVQVVPHVTDELVERILAMGGPHVDVVITEVGGTIGDIEGLPFLEAVRQVRHRVGCENSMVVHVSLIPFIAAAGELKTKPTQHSVAALRQAGVMPDALVLRSDRPLDDGITRKVALMCDVDERAVVSCKDASSIYAIPRALHAEGLDAYAVQRLALPFRDVQWDEWDDLMDALECPEDEVTIALVGKYVDLHDAYLSVAEALRAGGFHHQVEVKIRWVSSDECQTPAKTRKALKGAHAIIVPGGFGGRGQEGIMHALRHGREEGIPTLGICLGMQLMVVEAARHLLKLEEASSLEADPQTPHPVIAMMDDQKSILAAGALGGTMRLGSYPAVLREGSLVQELYGAAEVTERHRHRYEVNGAYREDLEGVGLKATGTSPDGALVEFVELEGHPFYVGTQAHPEFKSRPTQAHPLFAGLVEAALRFKDDA